MKEERLSLRQILESQDPLKNTVGSKDTLVARYKSCPLCGSNLHFNHITDFILNTTHEIAKCPECRIKVRELMHKLQ